MVTAVHCRRRNLLQHTWARLAAAGNHYVKGDTQNAAQWPYPRMFAHEGLSYASGVHVCDIRTGAKRRCLRQPAAGNDTYQAVSETKTLDDRNLRPIPPSLPRTSQPL